ncbi:FAD-dependent monooxygenase [Streptomyces natalensis]|uniref:FAD-dependent oxidoreductase n=1 Tax=Streptomyces natalensis ATCC 27448 TaxID=1240678 RepID=A0A0D7CIC8_9ACTN|nr:FAD-dependent monooxygenase [Streptomyces natalensis]KIZ15791.1 FAD-dependent oxidoreductase [Streptomyces natalensis ATCC 27448]
MRAVVCGAGIAGLALAQRLDALGSDVVVLEKAQGPRTQGYMVDFFGPGYDAAEAMGALPRLRELGYQVEEASFLDGNGRRRGGVQYTHFAKAVQGRLLSIMRPDLERALRESLSNNVVIRFGTSLTHVTDRDDGGVRLTLTDESTLDADLLVGADGIHSTVRSLVFGAERQYLRYLGFHTAAFTFDDPGIHAQVRGRFCLTDTVGRQMGFYGLRDGRVAVFAVHRTPDPALPADVRAAVREEYGSLDWIVPRALGRCPSSAEVYYDQVAQITMPRWSRGRVVLIGDACQAVSLLAGQGASLGVAGAYVLAEQLARADCLENGLTRYERMWRPVVEEKQQVGRKSARWFLPESQLQLRARRAVMKLLGLPGGGRYLATTLAGKPTAVVKELHATRQMPRHITR